MEVRGVVRIFIEEERVMGEVKNVYDDAYNWHVVKELVKTVPNDQQLGNEVRMLFWKTRESNE